jgi:hypothetical protein
MKEERYSSLLQIIKISWMKEDKGLKAEIDEIEEKLTCVKC